jgi:uncharacterized RDD family membrane protein YckC
VNTISDGLAGNDYRDGSEAPVAYATFARRVRALITDMLVQVTGIVVIVIVGGFLPNNDVVGRALMLAFVAVLVLYEPLLVWRYGSTVGHRLANLRVVADATGGNPGFLRALARFLIKGVLGLFSFLTMTLTRRHQAVHDTLTHTTVQVRDLERANAGDFVEERIDLELPGTPSRGRRLAAILAYLVMVYVLMVSALLVVLSSDCAQQNICTAGESALQTALGLMWLAASAAVIVFGWHARLWGARRRVAPTEVNAPEA